MSRGRRSVPVLAPVFSGVALLATVAVTLYGVSARMRGPGRRR